MPIAQALLPEFDHEMQNTRKLLDRFDQNVVDARKAIAGASDEHLMKTWNLVFNGKTVMSMPRGAVLRAMVMSHLVHHRAHLGVYLRLKDIPVPGMYGPSADDPNMFGHAG